jgi:nucleotide-binding universal stress UspA family protein
MEAKMKNILVLVHDDAGQEARLQAALDLARALNGHLTCIHVAIVPAAVDDYAMLGGSALLLADEQRSESANRTRVDTRLKAEGVPYAWIDTTGFASPSVCHAAGLADLVVLNRAVEHAYPNMEDLVGEVLIKSGRPVLAVPARATGLDASGPALIAWDGSTEAGKALRAAVPLLRLSSSVTLIEIDDGSIQWPANAAAIYLSRHNVECTIAHLHDRVDIPSTMLLEQIRNRKAAYLVMGAYGHSRFVEAALGGVTRRLLRESSIPLFMMH